MLVPELKREYGMDLRDLFLEVPPWSPRFVLAHVNNLPLESAFVAECRGGQKFRGWDEDRYMTANLINAIRAVQYTLVLAHRDPNRPMPEPPTPYPIPDDDVRKPKAAQPGSFAFVMGAHMAQMKKQKEGS